ncbi:MAG TPA: DUF3349 domain-containing protein [Mycobacteriales bacterium]|jgi:anti-sigma factor RsiW|nr:DUF3349 domain-containing protein [Mycobacteriales bacterium]
MELPPLLASIVGWLRAGYPDGVPEHDYVPLFALLSSQLSDEEVAEIASALASDPAHPASAEAVREAISAVTNGEPNDIDVARVRSRLAAGGWPLARPDRLSSTN